MKKKQTQIKTKKHKALSIVLPVVGGAALITAATVGTVFALKGTNAPVAPEQTKVTLNPGDETAKMVFTFNDDIADNKVLASLKELSAAGNASDTPTVIFDNGTLKQDITVKDGKAEVRVKLLNPPSEEGTFKYNFSMYFKYTQAEANEEIVREVKNLELVYTNTEEKIYIEDPVSQLTQSVPLNDDRTAKIVFKGFKYRGEISKDLLNVETKFGTDIAFDSKFEVNERNKAIDVTINVKQGYSTTVNGGFTFTYQGKDIHKVDFKVSLTEDDTIIEPQNGSDRYISIPLTNQVEVYNYQTFEGKFTYTGLADAEQSSDVRVTFTPDDDMPTGIDLTYAVTNLHTGRDEKYFNVQVGAKISDIEYAYESHTINGTFSYEYKTQTGEWKSIQVATHQTFTINLAALGSVIVPDTDSTMVHRFAKFDASHQTDTIVFEGFKYSGMEEIASEDDIDVSFINNEQRGETYTADVIYLNPRTKSFTVELKINMNGVTDPTDRFDWQLSTGSFSFTRQGKLLEVSNPDKNNYSFHLGQVDDVDDGTVQKEWTVKANKDKVATVSIPGFVYKGLEWTEDFTWQKDNLYFDNSIFALPTGVALKSVAFNPELPTRDSASYGLFTLEMQFTVDDETIDHQDAKGGIIIREKEFTNGHDDDDHKDVVLKTISDIVIHFWAADTIKDTTDSKTVVTRQTIATPGTADTGTANTTFNYTYTGIKNPANLTVDTSGLTSAGTVTVGKTLTPETHNLALTLTWTGLDQTLDYTITGYIVFNYRDEITGQVNNILTSTDYHITLHAARDIEDITSAAKAPTVDVNDAGVAYLDYVGFKFHGFEDDPLLTGLKVTTDYTKWSVPEGVALEGTPEIINVTGNTFDVRVTARVNGPLSQVYDFATLSSLESNHLIFTKEDSQFPLNKTFIGFGGKINAFGTITEPTTKHVEDEIRPDGTQTVKFVGFKTTGFDSLAKRNSLKVSGFTSQYVALSIKWKQEEDKSWSFDVVADVTATVAGYKEENKALTFTVGDGKTLYQTDAEYSITLTDCVDVIEPTNTEVLLDYVNPSSYTFRFTGFQFTGIENPGQLTVALTSSSTFPTGTNATLTQETGTPYYTVSVTTPSLSGTGEWSTGFQFKYGDTVVAETTKSYKASCQEISVDISGNSTMLKQQVQALTATVVTAGGTIEPSQDLTWLSSDTTVATVKNGVVTASANKTGTVYITATSGYGVSNTFTIDVVTPTVTIEFESGEPKTELNVGEVARVYAAVAPTTKVSQDVTWSSNNEAVANVKKATTGVNIWEVTANAPGSAKIRATSVVDPTQYAEITFTVKDASITVGETSTSAPVTANLTNISFSFDSWAFSGLSEATKSLVTVEKINDQQFIHADLDWVTPRIIWTGGGHQAFTLELWGQAKTPSASITGLKGSVQFKYAGTVILTQELTLNLTPYLTVTADPDPTDSITLSGLASSETAPCTCNTFTFGGEGADTAATYTDHVTAVAEMVDTTQIGNTVTVAPNVTVGYSAGKATFTCTFTRHVEAAEVAGKSFTIKLTLYYNGKLWHTSGEIQFQIIVA